MLIICAISFILMLALGGSTGPFFPYLNMIGAFIFGFICIWSSRGAAADENNTK